MSKLAEFKRLEARLAEHLAALNNLKDDAGLRREIEFERKLKALMEAYGFGLKTIMAVLAAPARSALASPRRARRRPNPLKAQDLPESVHPRRGADPRQ